MVRSRDIKIKNGCALSAQQLKIKKINSVLCPGVLLQHPQ